MTYAELKPIVTRLERIEEKLDTIYSAWQQAQGGAKFAKILFFAIGALMGAIYWIRDHIRW